MKKQAAPVSGAPRLPLAVYTSLERRIAVTIKHTPDGIWYLFWADGVIELLHCSEGRFTHQFPRVLPNYPIRRAVRKFHESNFRRDERTEKVLLTMLRPAGD